MGLLSRLLFGRRKRGTRSNPVKPHVPSWYGQSRGTFNTGGLDRAGENNSGYVLLTNKKDHDEQYLGRKLQFDSNRGIFSRGATEKALLDGQVIWETQISSTNWRKVRDEFFDEFAS